MAASFRSFTATQITSNVTSITCNAPSGVSEGDLLLAFCYSVNETVIFNPPVGWSTDYCFYKVATASEPSTYTFTITNSGPNNTYPASIILVDYLGGARIDAIPTPTINSGTSIVAPVVTTTQTSETVLTWWVAQNITNTTSPTITGPSGSTQRAISAVGAGSPGPIYSYVTDYIGPSTPGSSAPGTATCPYSSNWQAYTFSLKTAGPLAPTLYTPNNSSYTDLAANGGPFTWDYNNGGATPAVETGFNFRRKVSGGSYVYWTGSVFQSTDPTAPAVSSSALSYTFPTGGSAVWTDGNTYNWSVASTDAVGEGPYALDFTVNAQAGPTLVVNTPTGTVTTTSLPTVTWTDTLAGGATQLNYRVVTYTYAQTQAIGFSPGLTTAIDDSGVVASTSLSYTIATYLTSGTTYVSYVQVTQTPGDNISSWASTSYTISIEPPATPTITAAYNTDPSTSCPRIELTVTTQDNILSANDASFEGSLGTTAAITNCTVSKSSTEALAGNSSCKMSSTASGNMSCGTATGTSGYTVLPNTQYTAMSSYYPGSTARSVRTDINWYTSTGSAASPATTTGTVVTEGLSAWKNSLVTVTSPSNAAYAEIIHNVLSTGASSELHYVDEAGIFPGTVTEWTMGGFVGISTIAILRSDGLYVRYASLANLTPVIEPSQVTTVYDYEATPYTEYTYTAITIAGGMSSFTSSASSEVEVPAGLGFWILDPTDYSSATKANPTSWNTQNYEQSTTHPVLGQTTVNVIASAMQVPDMQGTFATFTAAQYTNLFALATSQKTVFISDPYGLSYYFRLAPAPGGLSLGTGNKANDMTLIASTASGPRRDISLTGVGQPRPVV